jgi:hypothetical protein
MAQMNPRYVIYEKQNSAYEHKIASSLASKRRPHAEKNFESLLHPHTAAS